MVIRDRASVGRESRTGTRTFLGRDSHRGAERSRGPRGERRGGPRRIFRSTKFYSLKEGDKIEYKNLILLQKYLSERGKVLSRRFTGISAKDQRKIVRAIKRARFLGLLSVGRVK